MSDLTFQQLVRQYGNSDEIWYHEKNPVIVAGLKASRASSSWACGEIPNTGWVKLSQLSPHHEGGKTIVTVTRKTTYEKAA